MSRKFDQESKLRTFWERYMRSAHRKMSEGAREIARVIPWGKGDCWRRKDKVQRGHEHKKK